MVLPIFLSIPDLDVGIPVSLENCCFAFVIPKARFYENDTPGILKDCFFAIITIYDLWAMPEPIL